jgi:hypothetical protein
VHFFFGAASAGMEDVKINKKIARKELHLLI